MVVSLFVLCDGLKLIVLADSVYVLLVAVQTMGSCS